VAEVGEEAIRSRHELYRLVLENASDLIALATADGRLLYASPSHERLLGWTSEELVGFDAVERVHRDDVGALREALAGALTTGTASIPPVRVRRRDGSWLVLESRLSAVSDDATGEVLLLVVSRDVTAARQASELLAATLGAVTDAITVVSAEGRIVYANAPALELIGFGSLEELAAAAPAEVLARFELFDANGLPLAPERIPTRRALAGEGVVQDDIRWRVRTTGEERCSVVRAEPVVGEDGAVRLAVAVFHDVTAERRADADRLRLDRITEAALAYLSLQELAHELLLRSSELLEADTAAIFLLDDEGTALEVRATVGLESDHRDWRRVPLGEGFAGRVAAAREALIEPDAARIELVNTALHDHGIRALIGVPLLVEGRLLGVLRAGSCDVARFTDDDLRVLRLAADRIALALNQASLYEAAKDAQARLALLAEASDALGATLDVERALADFAQRVAPGFADVCAIQLLAEDGTAALVALEPPEAAMPDDALVVPLVARGRTLGTVAFAGVGPRAEDEEVALELARRAAVAVENAELHREAQERGRAARILESVGDGVLLVGGDGCVRFWNEAAAAITGLPWRDVLDRPAIEAIPGWATIASLVPVGGPPQSLPLPLGGREGWISISGVAVEEGTVYAFRDLTEERALEELRADFVSTVSHELRTPLAAIYGAAQTLRREDVRLDEEQRDQLLGVVGSEADRLARTVNDILWASRLDAAMLDVAIESCDAGGLAGAVVAAQRAHLPERVELALEVEVGLPPVAADADKVRQVLVNLVDNAVKYSPDGGRIALRVALRGTSIRFAVADEGLGIPYADQRRIFEKFYRLDPQLTRGVGGTGLGLYISRELVRRMGGRLWVQSTPGRGSTFSVELPVAPENESGRPEGRPESSA
jgi:two-component system phosphate regulon sensor histidine kinase PhoR